MVADTAGGRNGGDGFVGRTAETTQLALIADKARAGSPQFVRVEGEAGIGKTYLVNHFLAGLDGFGVLTVNGDPGETALSYALIDQLLARLDRPVAAQFSRLGRRWSAGASPFSVGADLLDLIGDLVQERPLALVLDDAQWSDPLSVHALAFALRRLWADPVLVVVMVRTPLSDADQDVVSRYLGRLTIESETIRMTGLTARDIADLSAGLPSGPLSLPAAARLRAHTSGNPLYVRALLTEAAPADLFAVGASLPVPRSLVVAIGRILARLPADTRRLVEALAVLNTRCALARVAGLASVRWPGESLAPALDAGLVQWWPAEPASPVAMRHALHRDAVYESLEPQRRAELHAAAARLVDQRGAWAHRVAAAQSTDATLADELEQAAAAQTDAGDHDVAARYLHWAAELSETRTEYERRLLTACAQSLLGVHPGWALSMRAEMLRCAATPLRDCTLGLTALLGSGEMDAGEDFLRRAESDDAPDWVRSMVACGRASLYMWRGCGAEVIRETTLAMSFDGLAPRWRDFARLLQAVAVGRQDGLSAALDSLDHLPDNADSVSTEDLESLCCRGALHVMLGRYDLAITDLTVAIRHQRAGVDLVSGPTPHSYLAAAQYALGDWDDALITVEQGLSIQATFGQPQHFTLAQMVATVVPAARGEWEVAERHVSAAQYWANRIGAPQDLRYAAIAGAVLARARGDHDGMLTALRVLREADDADSTHTWWLAWWYPLLVEALAGVGELDAAEQLLGRMRTVAGDVQQLEDTVCRLRALLLCGRGAPERALAVYRHRLDQPGTPRLPLGRAMLQHDYGVLLSATGHRRDARRWLHRARSGYAVLGARPFLSRVDDALSAVGAPPEELAGRVLPELTKREQQVSFLACRGRTNSEIAKELYVTVKTVEYHLSNVYAKLAVGSRRELRNALGTGDQGTGDQGTGDQSD